MNSGIPGQIPAGKSCLKELPLVVTTGNVILLSLSYQNGCDLTAVILSFAEFQ